MKARNLFIVLSALGIGLFFYLEHLDIFRNCHYGLIESLCNPYLYLPGSALLIAFPILFFSLVTYFLDPRIAAYWQKYTIGFLIVFVLLVLFLPEDGGGGWISGGSPTKATYALLMSGVYFIICTLMILRRVIRLHHANKSAGPT